MCCICMNVAIRLPLDSILACSSVLAGSTGLGDCLKSEDDEILKWSRFVPSSPHVVALLLRWSTGEQQSRADGRYGSNPEPSSAPVPVRGGGVAREAAGSGPGPVSVVVAGAGAVQCPQLDDVGVSHLAAQAGGEVVAVDAVADHPQQALCPSPKASPTPPPAPPPPPSSPWRRGPSPSHPPSGSTSPSVVPQRTFTLG